METSNTVQNTDEENIKSTSVNTISEEPGSKENATHTENICSENTNVDKCKDNGNEQSNKNIEKTPDDDSKVTFKKPVLLIGPRRGHITKLRTLSQTAVVEAFANHEPEKNNLVKDELLLEIQKAKQSETLEEMQKEKKIMLPYSEPSWSGLPEDIYKLEVLKSGTIIEVIDLSDKSFHIVGRLPSCDISMAHPTISRYHAILQYRATGNETNGKGLYVYDLGSTHGTFWNGNRIKPKVYVRLQGGHMIRFGCSQRKFIVQAPLNDQEVESEFSVTQLKELRKLELEEREKLEKQRLLEEEEVERLRKEKEETEGIDWGMGEDADEETDLIENPYAQSNNEELFLTDPKKTLRGWFEREGVDMQYQTEDKGIGRFLCWIDLPIDNYVGKVVRAEALVTGKKKEAVIQCALEACRVLDRYGLLRQANHEARKRKSRNWEEEDYYDSDEDNFLDRTGTIEKKREQRMKIAGKLDTKAETYDSLLEKHSKIAERITNIEKTIALHKLKQDKDDDSDVDALDAFMSTLDSSTLNKTEIRKIKMELLNLRKEEMQLLKLINIAKPANLPPLEPHVPNTTKKLKEQFKDLKSMIGHKKKVKCSKQTITLNDKTGEPESNKNLSETLEERLEEEQINERITKEETDKSDKGMFNSTDENIELDDTTKTRMICDTETNEELDKDIVKKKKKYMKRHLQRMEKATKELQKDYDDNEFREDYSMWLPPENQSGDGKTSLNAKFGY